MPAGLFLFPRFYQNKTTCARRSGARDLRFPGSPAGSPSIRGPAVAGLRPRPAPRNPRPEGIWPRPRRARRAAPPLRFAAFLNGSECGGIVESNVWESREAATPHPWRPLDAVMPRRQASARPRRGSPHPGAWLGFPYSTQVHRFRRVDGLIYQRSTQVQRLPHAHLYPCRRTRPGACP